MHSFQLSGLPAQNFSALFELDDAQLAERAIQRVTAEAHPGYPCRVGLVDAEVGDELLLLPFEHQSAASPYRASGPIFVSRRTHAQDLAAGRLPPYLTRRLVSVRAYDAADRMVDADVVDGNALAELITRILDNADVAYLHLHAARRGCYLCRVDRVAISP
ncbi:DUF1203 domain-containing protein [Dokdonella immobilis]|uniref:DUF1203 domain-containing protein n=1 Tax=Dokdonella immobilis TaxID=578942 RepID=A0A1I4ZXY0_9GAMM|nr:DUF1203 domain-containing protein [Dokdonella immobilis]SFN55031.1 Protein of unknown function [Dokdonella immobilis]